MGVFGGILDRSRIADIFFVHKLLRKPRLLITFNMPGKTISVR